VFRSIRFSLTGLVLAVTISPLSADDDTAPQRLSPSPSARPIWTAKSGAAPKLAPAAKQEAKEAPKTVVVSGGLKWRPSKKLTARKTAATKRPAAKPSPVVRAAHHQQADPFDDPFGDRLAQMDPQAESDATAPAPAADPDVSVLQAPDTTAADDLDVTPAVPAAPAAELPAPTAEDEAYADDELEDEKPCPGAYDGRNFCEAREKCDESWAELAQHPLKDISLDISPPFKPDEDDPAEVAESRKARLARDAVRKWRGVKGNRLGLLGDKVLGLDGADWQTRPTYQLADDLEGKAVQWDNDSVTVATIVPARGPDGRTQQNVDKTTVMKAGPKIRLLFNQLSRDDNEFVKGRQWRTRDGQKEVFGRLTDYRDGHVFVAKEDGTTERISFRRLADADLDFVTAYWRTPAECTLPQETVNHPKELRDWTMLTYTWKASGLCHKPLYFEQRQLERYGHSAGPILQPILSGAHFFSTIAIVPYKMGMNPPQECQYTLGYYRPGSCAPYLVSPIPLSIRGGLTQAAAMVGGAYILP